MAPRSFVSEEMKEMEAILRCSICYDFMATSMMTKCSHNYCSLCIRKYLTFKSQCPTCFQDSGDADLRNNRALDEIITLFTKLKDAVQNIPMEERERKQSPTKTYVQEERERTPQKQSSVSTNNVFREEVSSCCQPTASSTKMNALKTPEKFNFRSYFSPRKGTPEPKVNHIQRRQSSSPSGRSNAASTEGLFSRGADDSRPTGSSTNHCSMPTTSSVSNGGQTVVGNQTISKKVPCPVCTVEVSEAHINTHLDACLKREHHQQPAPAKREPDRKRLTKYVYHLMADKDIKKKIREFKLNPVGDRKTLISRLQRYTILYNADCDSSTPRDPKLIVQEVEREEAAQTKRNAPVAPINKKSNENEIEAYRSSYLKSNESHFSKLINDIKSRKQNRGKSLQDNDQQTSISNDGILNREQSSCSNGVQYQSNNGDSNSTDVFQDSSANIGRENTTFKRINPLESDLEDDPDDFFPLSQNVKRTRFSHLLSESDEETGHCRKQRSLNQIDSDDGEELNTESVEKQDSENSNLFPSPSVEHCSDEDSEIKLIIPKKASIECISISETSNAGIDGNKNVNDSCSGRSPLFRSHYVDSSNQKDEDPEWKDDEQILSGSSSHCSSLLCGTSMTKLIESPMKRTKDWVEQATHYHDGQRRSRRIAQNRANTTEKDEASITDDDLLVDDQKTVILENQDFSPIDRQAELVKIASLEISVASPSIHQEGVVLSTSDSENTQPMVCDDAEDDTQPIGDLFGGSSYLQNEKANKEKKSSQNSRTSHNTGTSTSTPLKNLQLFEIRSPILTRTRKRNREEIHSTPTQKQQRARRKLNK